MIESVAQPTVFW